jgi:hypothetical protein
VIDEVARSLVRIPLAALEILAISNICNSPATLWLVVIRTKPSIPTHPQSRSQPCPPLDPSCPPVLS